MVLSLVNKEGNPTPARLYVRVMHDSMSAVASDVMEQAQSANVSRPLDTHVFDALSDQQSLLASFGAVLKLIDPFIKIGDEIAKVCTLVSYCVGR